MQSIKSQNYIISRKHLYKGIVAATLIALLLSYFKINRANNLLVEQCTEEEIVVEHYQTADKTAENVVKNRSKELKLEDLTSNGLKIVLDSIQYKEKDSTNLENISSYITREYIDPQYIPALVKLTEQMTTKIVKIVDGKRVQVEPKITVWFFQYQGEAVVLTLGLVTDTNALNAIIFKGDNGIFELRCADSKFDLSKECQPDAKKLEENIFLEAFDSSGKKQ